MGQIPIKKIGVVLQNDKTGFLESKSSPDKIQPPWRNVVDELVIISKAELGSKLHSVYIRGSISRGTAVEEVSDFDFLVILTDDSAKPQIEKLLQRADSLTKKYSFITKMDGTVKTEEQIMSPKGTVPRMLIKLFSACVYGEDLAVRIDPIRPGKGVWNHSYSFADDMRKQLTKLETAGRRIPLQQCRWIMKRHLRVGAELVSERADAITRDLYPCWELFSRFYPGQKQAMLQVLDLALNPTNQASEIKNVINTLGKFLSAEIEKQRVN